MRSMLTFGLLSLAFACSPGSENDAPEDTIQLDWQLGDSFHIAARKRFTADKGVEAPNALDAEDSLEREAFAPMWSEEVVWTYRVIESGLVPSADDTLYPYSITETGRQVSLAVLKVDTDAGLNSDAAILEADTTIYLVFREDRDRLAGLISFSTVNGERVEKAWSSQELGRSWSVLSQSQLTDASTFLAPFSARWTTGERLLENGRTMTTAANDLGGVDITFADELGGGTVTTTYEDGQPWPVFTAADGFEARLLTNAETERRRTHTPPPDDEDFDYRAALRASIDIDEALRLEADVIENGGFDSRVRDGFEPWAGAWWPLKDGELVLGFDDRPTISERIREAIDPIKLDLDKLSEELRDMDRSDEAYEEKVQTYRDKQKEVTDLLVEFYNGIQQDIDGGQLTVQEGKLVHTDGWEYEIDLMSPMDKFALVQQLEGNNYPNPWFLPAWELLNSYRPGGDSWWGHCNGWAAAAILTHEPRESKVVTVDGVAITFETADLKGLLTESHYSTQSSFYGARYNGEDDDLSDLSPAAFQRIVDFYIRQQEVPLVFDTTASEAVWNFPAYAVNLDMTETTADGALEMVDINTADFDTLLTLPEIGEKLAERIIDYREKHGPFQAVEGLDDVRGIGAATMSALDGLISVEPPRRTFDVMADVRFTTDGVDPDHIDGDEPRGFTESWGYTLVTDIDGTVVDGAWDDDNDHPDFAWIPYHNPTQGSRGGSENPYLIYGDMLEAFGQELDRR